MNAPAKRPGRQRNPDSETASVRTADRTLALLTHVAAQPGASLSELARRSGLSVSTAHRLLETLKRHQFVEHDNTRGGWYVGLGAYRVGASYLSTNDLLSAARTEAERLVADCHETVNIAVLDGADAVYLQQVEGRHMIRMFMRTGARAPLHCTGVGKALLAWRPAGNVQDLLGDGPYPAHTPHTLTSLDALHAELRRVREHGYAVDNEERELGVRCIAAPIWDEHAQVRAAISLSAPINRLGDERLPAVAARLVNAAQAVTERLGGHSPT